MTGHETPMGRREALKKGALATSALIVGGTAATGTAAAGIGEGRVGHYPLNNIRPDGTVHDASPERNDGTVRGDVSALRGDGRVGNAFKFDGGHIQIENDESLGVENVTIAAWVNPDGTKNKEYIFDGRNHQYGLKEDDGSEVPRFYIFDNDDNLHRLDAADSLSDGTWTHVAATYDGSEMKLYLNGAPSSTNDSPSRSIGSSEGLSRIGNYVDGDYSFRGELDEVRVYDRALSDSEIQSLAAMGGNSGGNGRGRGP